MNRIAVACLLTLSAAVSTDVEAMDLSAAGGATSQGGMTYRLGAGWDWDKSWWQSSVGRVTGYWSAGYTYWAAGDHGTSASSLSLAPVLVYEFAGDSIQPYIEAGIGIAAFSATEAGEQNLGSAFNFEDRIGFGMTFARGQKVGLRAIHYSNAGIKEPNDGIESFSLFYQQPL